jgi:hypothetical protein
VAALLAAPLFFVALMALSLRFEKPTVMHVSQNGKVVTKLGDPSSATETKIWLLSLVPSLVVIVAGAAAGMLLRRLGVVVSAVAAIAAATLLMLPLKTWERDHTARYPEGVDLVPKSALSQDIYLPGEWEASARRTADEIGIATIVLGGIAIGLTLFLELRRRRGIRRAPVPPPPPGTVEGASIARPGLSGDDGV